MQPVSAESPAPFGRPDRGERAVPRSTASPDPASIDAALDAIEEPWDPLERAALDGFLAGLALQPRGRRPRDIAEWARWIVDPDAGSHRALKSPSATPLVELAIQRLAHLDAAIESRQWFDPWIDAPDGDEEGLDDAASGAEDDEGDGDSSREFAEGDEAEDAELPDGASSPTAIALRPWVSGFSLAGEAFGDLMALGDPALVEPHALLYSVFAADELDDLEPQLAEAIEELEPAASMDEAVEDVVAAVLLISDVTRPLVSERPARPARAPRPNRTGGPGRPQGGSRRPPPSGHRN